MPETTASVVHYTSCPICESELIQEVFNVKDFSVSKESFPVWECKNCSGRFTQDVPTEDEIGKYYESQEYISHSNTSTGIVNRIYQQVRHYTLNQKKRKVESISNTKAGALLDIGCGTGEFAGLMSRSGWRVVGLEPSDVARRQALENQKLEAYPSEKLFDLPEGDFDVVTMWHVLEHVHRLHEYLAQIKNVLRRPGYLIIAVPNYKSPDAQHYGADWAAYDVPRHLYHFSPRSMEILLEKNGFTLESKRNMNLDSFYVSMLSERYRGNSPELVLGGWQGWRSFYKTWDKPDGCSSVLYVAKVSA